MEEDDFEEGEEAFDEEVGNVGLTEAESKEADSKAEASEAPSEEIPADKD